MIKSTALDMESVNTVERLRECLQIQPLTVLREALIYKNHVTFPQDNSPVIQLKNTKKKCLLTLALGSIYRVCTVVLLHVINEEMSRSSFALVLSPL